MGENPTMFMGQAKHNRNCHIGNSYHAFSVFGQIGLVLLQGLAVM
jgi:hypothetical protein